MGILLEVRQHSWGARLEPQPQVSDFGRTLTSNGLGTDHAWGGNQIVMGGAVRGGARSSPVESRSPWQFLGDHW